MVSNPMKCRDEQVCDVVDEFRVIEFIEALDELLVGTLN
jgi:hypothetical protein